MAGAILFLQRQFGGRQTDARQQEIRVVAETAAASGREDDLAVPFAFGKQRRGIVSVANQHDHAVVMRSAIRSPRISSTIFRLLRSFGFGLSGKPRGIHAGRAVEGINQDSRIVGECGSPVCRAALRAFTSAFSIKVTCGSSASGTPSALCGTGSMPSAPASARALAACQDCSMRRQAWRSWGPLVVRDRFRGTGKRRKRQGVEAHRAAYPARAFFCAPIIAVCRHSQARAWCRVACAKMGHLRPFPGPRSAARPSHDHVHVGIAGESSA